MRPKPRLLYRNKPEIDDDVEVPDGNVQRLRILVLRDWSGRKDLNLRPPGPEPGALARLRYAPNFIPYFHPVYAGLLASATATQGAKTTPPGSFHSPAAF